MPLPSPPPPLLSPSAASSSSTGGGGKGPASTHVVRVATDSPSGTRAPWPPLFGAPAASPAAKRGRGGCSRCALVACAAAIAAVALIAALAVAVAGISARAARGKPAVRHRGPPPVAVANATWHVAVYPAPGLRASASAARLKTRGDGAALPGTLFADVDTTSKQVERWRVQLRSDALRLSPDRAYSLAFEARSTGANVTARIVLHSEELQRLAGSRVVALGPDWRVVTLRLVQPPGGDAGLWGFTYQIQLGQQRGRHEFRNMRITSQPLDGAIVSPASAAARIAAHRLGEFELRFTGAAAPAPASTLADAVAPNDGPVGPPATVNLTLERHGFAFGAAIAPEVVRALYGEDVGARYLELLAENFWSITPENAFKWPYYEPVEGQFQEGLALVRDEYIGFAQAHSIPTVRGHTLEWGSSYRDLINGKLEEGEEPFWPIASGDCEFYRQALETRVRRDVRLFRGQFTEYDVLNEVIETPSMLSACGLLTPEYLTRLFRLAHAADPAAKLCLNEWAVFEGSNWEGLVELGAAMLKQGAPLHCIGAQAHLTANRTSLPLLWRRLEELAALGLPIYVTELTLAAPDESNSPSWTAPNAERLSEAEQAALLPAYVSLFYSHPSVVGVTLWGFWDGNIWVKKSGIFREDLSPKPSAEALQRFWRVQHNTTLRAAAVGAGGSVRWRGAYGLYRYEAADARGRPVAAGTFELRQGGPRVVEAPLA